MQYAIMSAQFEAEKNRKAFMYTAAICGAILLLLIFITIPHPAISTPVAQDLIEVNLGNDQEGFGEEQPMIKGEMSPGPSQPEERQSVAPPAAEASKEVSDDNETDEDAASVPKPEKAEPKKVIPDAPVTTPVKSPNPNPVVAPAPKPQKPKITYNGPGNGNGNNANEDNGYRYQGNNPNGNGDVGSPNGRPDSYGNTPGGRPGGPRVIGSNRKIIKYYAFTGDLEKATVYALVKVSAAGTGTFVGFGKNSTTRAQAYANAIAEYLRNVQFDKASADETVTVQFNFTVK